METKKIKVNLDRTKDEKDELLSVSMIFEGLGNVKLTLSESSTTDVEELFNCIFDKVIQDETLFDFYLEDNQADLFKEVSEDILVQLNYEINQSESNFEEIIALTKK